MTNKTTRIGCTCDNYLAAYNIKLEVLHIKNFNLKRYLGCITIPQSKLTWINIKILKSEYILLLKYLRYLWSHAIFANSAGGVSVNHLTTSMVGRSSFKAGYPLS